MGQVARDEDISLWSASITGNQCKARNLLFSFSQRGNPQLQLTCIDKFSIVTRLPEYRPLWLFVLSKGKWGSGGWSIWWDVDCTIVRMIHSGPPAFTFLISEILTEMEAMASLGVRRCVLDLLIMSLSCHKICWSWSRKLGSAMEGWWCGGV